jgi:hypothetical protein
MSKAIELARGHLNGADELLIAVHQPDNEPFVVIIKWPSAPSVAPMQAFQGFAGKAATLFAQAATRLAQLRRDGLL